MSQRSKARPQLPAPTADPVPGQAGQFYLSIRQDLVRDVRREVRQELRSGRRPSRKRRRGGRKERRVYWGREQLRRLRQSVGDQACNSSISALVAIWHDAAVLSSAQIQVVCASHQRTHMLFSVRAWRRYTQVTRCACDYRCNNSRSNRIVKPMFPCWRRSAVRTSTPCLWPDPHARSFVSAQVNHSMRVMLAQWFELTRHRVELCRVSSKFTLGRAWGWWCASVRTFSSVVVVHSDSFEN